MLFVQIKAKYFCPSNHNPSGQYHLRLKEYHQWGNNNDWCTALSTLQFKIPIRVLRSLCAFRVRVGTDFRADCNFTAFKQFVPSLFLAHAVLHDVSPTLYGCLVRPNIHGQQLAVLVQAGKPFCPDKALKSGQALVSTWPQGQGISAFRPLRASLQTKQEYSPLLTSPCSFSAHSLSCRGSLRPPRPRDTNLPRCNKG